MPFFFNPHHLERRAFTYAGVAVVIAGTAIAAELIKGQHTELVVALQHFGTALVHLLTDTTAAEITAGVIFKAVGGGH